VSLLSGLLFPFQQDYFRIVISEGEEGNYFNDTSWLKAEE